MNKLPRLNVGWDEQPGLFPRYWDTAMTAIEGGSTSTTNEVYIDQFYPTSSSTDSDALTCLRGPSSIPGRWVIRRCTSPPARGEARQVDTSSIKKSYSRLVTDLS
jgi:hypothetical protein